MCNFFIDLPVFFSGCPFVLKRLGGSKDRESFETEEEQKSGAGTGNYKVIKAVDMDK